MTESYTTPVITPNVQLRSQRTAAERDAHKPASIGRATRTVDISAVPLNVNVIRSYISVTVDGITASSGCAQICSVNGTEVRSGSGPTIYEIPVQLTTARSVVIDFAYQLLQYGPDSNLLVTFQDVSVTAVYEQPAEDYADNSVLVPVKTVMLYEPMETDFSKNGIVMHPTSCIVEEEAAGTWELTMEHPFDPEGRWRSLLEEYIIKAPVPPYKIPETSIPVGKVYKVKSTVEKAALYSQLPTYTKAEVKYTKWNVHTEYHKGDCVWYEPTMTYYRSGGTNFGNDQSPGSTGGLWFLIGPVNPSSSDPGSGTGTYSPGVIIRDLLADEPVTFIATYNAKYVKVRDQLGNVGYAIAENLEETQTAPAPYLEPERTIYTQLFRIYAVSCEETAGTVTVNARHISYDYQANGVYDCKLVEAEPATAIALLQGRLMNPDNRLIACPINYPLVSADWSFGNPMQALLDPDDGLAAQLHAKVLRDNGDFFILPDKPNRIGARLAYGVNLRGVTWERNSDDIVTRIIPRAGDGSNGFIYLDETFVDSEHINEYAVIHVEVLDSEYSVGQTIEHADGTTQTLNRDNVIQRMRQEALDRFYYDQADVPTVTLDVDFVLLGDTEEYREYRNLQRINLYDTIEIDTGSTTVSAQVIGYEWDCLMGRYNGISIGKVYSQARKRIPGYRVATGAITYSKLSPGLVKWIKGVN